MDIQASLQSLRSRLRITPYHADVWNDFATLLAFDGQWAAAKTAVEEALELNPEFPLARISRCFLLGELGDVAGAFQEFKRIHIRNPNSFETIFPLGVFCLHFGWVDDGADLIRRAAERRPNIPYVLLHNAAARREVGDRDGARQQLANAQEAAKALPFDAEEIAHLFTDEHVDSLRRWRNPLLARAHVIAANAVPPTSDAWEQSCATLLEANRRHPGVSHLMVALGKTYAAANAPEASERWLTSAIHLHRRNHHAQLELGFLAVNMGDEAKAEAAFREAVALRPLFPDYRYHLGTFLLEKGDPLGAIEQLRRVLLIQPNFAHAALQLASLYLDRGRPREAISLLSRGLCRDWTEAWIVRARAHAAIDEFDEARSLLNQVPPTDPGSSEALELLLQLS